jgi:hypothetical protein
MHIQQQHAFGKYQNSTAVATHLSAVPAVFPATLEIGPTRSVILALDAD